MVEERRTTLADVARRAGMSTAAASMILNNRPGTRLSAEAERRVKDAAAELGYRPNVAARGLRTSLTNTIGFISDNVSVTRFATGQIRGALRAAEAAGHVVLVVEAGDDRERETKAVEAVLDRQVDGIIFAAVRAREIDVPPVPPGTRVVLLNATSAGVATTVLPAEFEGGRTAVRAIAEAGHSEGVILVGQNDAREGDVYASPNVESRVMGISTEMSARDLTFRSQLPVGLWTADGAYEALKQHLATAAPPRCILVLNDPMAFGVYRALGEAGLSIPHDVSVISFDDDEITDYLWPKLTTIGLPYEAMGEAAVDLLLGSESGGRLIPMPLVMRDSLASPGRGGRKHRPTA